MYQRPRAASAIVTNQIAIIPPGLPAIWPNAPA